ncbi:serine/threonine protein phosphatase, partial [Streptomyces albiflaviniger]|nr:serine/threonine protein phosphatase [Streptomyces albiflaviniger]
MNFTRWSARLPRTQRRIAARADRGARRPKPAAAAGGGSVPAARGESADPSGHGEPPAAAPCDAASPAAVPTLDGLSAHDLLGQVPALVAVVYGPEHRIAYLNDTYVGLFGSRTPGTPAGQALPELRELGLLPLMDQVLRSGKPRTVKSRRVPAGGPATTPGPRQEGVAPGPGRSRHGYYTFTCSPIEMAAPKAVAPARPADERAGEGAVDGTPVDGRPVDGSPVDGSIRDGAIRKAVAVPEAVATETVATDTGPATEPDPATEPVRGVLVFGADVTDQVESAERLRASERLQREAAVTLQHSLLPQGLEQPDDLRVAATY